MGTASTGTTYSCTTTWWPLRSDGNVKLKFINWGIDEILKPDRGFLVGTIGRVSGLVVNDPGTKQFLISSIRQLSRGVFSPYNVDNVVMPFVDRARAILKANGASGITEHTDILRHQIKII
ncbi:hypothetical protein OQA88_1255 [Cercophora sp. LCS_1]